MRGLVALQAADPTAVYVRPTGRLTGNVANAAIYADAALPSGRPNEAWSATEIILRGRESGSTSFLIPYADLRHWLDRADASPVTQRLDTLLERISAPRADWAGLSLQQPQVMGILNITPDSFSDGGLHLNSDAAIAAGRAMLASGAAILDIGGESTRPGATPILPEVELARIMPAVETLAAETAISVDTRHTPVMAEAMRGGARIINDVTALSSPDALKLAAETRAAVVLMHMQGEPGTMQVAPAYACAPLDIFDYLETRILACEQAGIPRASIVVDPGIGFGKSAEHNLAILRWLGLYRATGCGVLLGISRKGIIGALTGITDAAKRITSSAAAGLIGVQHGADILRVHDVAETVEALRVLRGLE